MSTLETDGFSANPPAGYFVDYQTSTSTPAEFQHFFCGEHDIQSAWCPNCDKPLLRFLSLDTRDARLNLQASPFPALPLLFCWTCHVAQETFLYRILDTGAIAILSSGQGGAAADFPYEDYPVFFPGASARLTPLTQEEQSYLIQLNNRFEDGAETENLYGKHRALWRVRHQVGGEPYFTQGLCELSCPICHADMPLLASIADDCLDTQGLAGDAGVQALYHYCRQCQVVGAYQTVD